MSSLSVTIGLIIAFPLMGLEIGTLGSYWMEGRIKCALWDGVGVAGILLLIEGLCVLLVGLAYGIGALIDMAGWFQ